MNMTRLYGTVQSLSTSHQVYMHTLMLNASTELTAEATAITPRLLARTTRTGARHLRTPSQASTPQSPRRCQLGQGPAEKSWCCRNLVLTLMLMLSTHSTSMREHMYLFAFTRFYRDAVTAGVTL